MHRLKLSIHEFFYTLLAFPRAWRFMRNHRLWEGLREYGWVARSLVGIGVFGAAYVIFEAVDWYDHHADAPLSAMMSGESLFLQWFNELTGSFSEGLLNWVTLILLEVVIYHFMRRTLQIVLKKNVENAHTFKPFVNAQIRMIMVSTVALVGEALILNAGEMITDGPVFWLFSLFIRSTMLGYVIADNYNEQFGLSIDQSRRHLYRGYIGICFGLGLPLLLMMKVPFFGTVLGPLVTSVTAAIVLREKSDLHIIGYQMNEKERAAAEKKAAKKARKLQKKRQRSVA
ncbi:hypothetical protein FUA23_16455 [Neolewinella aurantiaca]|uniref:Uncharacterized protein n=1 Tax=Neolewinella aurantiaca TaxID=2602767 RepID=A0A5C7FNW5_9BACT|nr:hypothetical protein [Neolewinella aurantiaca]TXF88072.1 hypothetical protein FUA23_16455 [Neolewinella aurantiaca]